MSTDASNSPTPHPKGLPPAEQLAVESIAALLADGYTNSMMRLPRPVLNELGRRLVTLGTTDHEAAVEWLQDEGHPASKSAVYRFCQRYREVYKQVVGDWQARLVMAGLADEAGVDEGDLIGFNRRRVQHLIALELSSTQAEELDTDRMRAITAAIKAGSSHALDAERLQLDRDAAELRSAKLAAEIDRLRQDNEERQRRFDASMAKAKSDVEKKANESADGRIGKDDVLAIIDARSKGEAA